MNTRRIVTTMLLVVSVLLMGACAGGMKTTPEVVSQPAVVSQPSVAKTTTSIQSVQNDMKAMTDQIIKTNTSLNQVIQAKGSPAAKGAVDAFSANVSQMEKAAAAFVKNSDQMAARGTDYFDEWRRSGEVYTNPQLQRMSEKRRDDLNDTFRQIADSSSVVKGLVGTYLAEINQIRIHLMNDSRAAIDAIVPAAERSISDGQQIITLAQPIMTAAEDARLEIGTAGAAAGGVSPPAQ